MTPEQIELVIRNTIGGEAQRYMLLSAVLVVVASFLFSYFGSYLSTKANRRAIEEGLESLTKQVSATTKAAEEIKAQIGTSSWVQQQRWDLKRQLYTDLLSTLYKLVDGYRYIVDLTLAENNLGHPMLRDQLERVQALLQERESQVPKMWEEVIRVRGFGELVLSKETIDSLNRLHKPWTDNPDPGATHIDLLEGRLAALRNAHEEIVASAKQDMEL